MKKNNIKNSSNIITSIFQKSNIDRTSVSKQNYNFLKIYKHKAILQLKMILQAVLDQHLSL